MRIKPVCYRDSKEQDKGVRKSPKSPTDKLCRPFILCSYKKFDDHHFTEQQRAKFHQVLNIQDVSNQVLSQLFCDHLFGMCCNLSYLQGRPPRDVLQWSPLQRAACCLSSSCRVQQVYSLVEFIGSSSIRIQHDTGCHFSLISIHTAQGQG